MIAGCFYDPGPPDILLDAAQAFSVAEVLIVPGELSACALNELFPGGVSFEIVITEAEAQFCIARLTASIVEVLFVVPKGVEHRPVAREETHLLLIETEGTPNTGDAATAAKRRVI